MNYCSYFIKDRALFGSFPTQESVNELIKEGVTCFVNLTLSEEKHITPYETTCNYIHYPIIDNYIPTDWKSYSRFIITLANILKSSKPGEKMYIHCKGGHGRSGIVVASLLCYVFGLTPTDALEYTTKCHSNRHTMRDKWRKIGSPQTHIQKKFIYNFFSPLKIHSKNKLSLSLGFSIFSSHGVNIDGVLYPTLYNAIVSLKIKECCEEPLLYNIFKKKLDQHSNIRDNLLSTGLRPIQYITDIHSMWEQKTFSTILTRLREEYYKF